jgi:hypothetical protein
MIGSKRWFAQQVLIELQNDKPNIDFKIDEREVFNRMDAEVNQMARTSFFDNWKFSSANLDEQFLTRWDDDNALTVVDVANGQPSYLDLPAAWVDLPRNRGIDEIWPLERGEYNQSVVITSHRDLRSYQNNKAGNMQGRLFGYPKGRRFVFGESNVSKKYGEKFGVSLVIRDSSQIGYDEVYPIPADKQKALIMILVAWFRSRREQPTDRVRDSNDNA